MALFRTLEEKKLLRALAQNDARGPWVSAQSAWNAFKEYARDVKLDDGTGLLFQVGTHNLSGRPLFYFHPVCQFERVDAEGKYEAYEQLHCELTCQPSPTTDGLGVTLWSFDFSDCGDFFAAVEALPEFQTAVGQGLYRLEVSCEQV